MFIKYIENNKEKYIFLKLICEVKIYTNTI